MKFINRVQPRAPSDYARWLGLASTSTALCMSVLAGWQRGGWLSERIAWVALGAVLVLSAHLLPSLCRTAPVGVRLVGRGLWVLCMAVTCYGHSMFFLLAQQHAAELRTSVQPVPAPTSSRNLTVVMSERASVIAQLATARARYCAGNCATLEARRDTLAARLDALNAEAEDVRRTQAADDRAAARRNALVADPVTSRVAMLLGMTTTRIDLLSGLAFAAVLEGVACLLWTVALRSSPLSVPFAAATLPTVVPLPESAADMPLATQPEVTPVTASTHGHVSSTISCEPVSDSHDAQGHPVPPLPAPDAADDDVTQLACDIDAGRVRATVADIRRHLGCSQARAVAFRRQIVARATRR